MGDNENKDPINPDNSKAEKPLTNIEKARLAKAAKRATQNDLQYIQENQAYAFSITTALSRLSISDKLDDSNYATWSEQMIGNLSSLFFDHLIFPIPTHLKGISTTSTKDAFYNSSSGKWTRKQSLYNDEVDPDGQSQPDLLWILIEDHHQCENEAAIYLYQTKLDQLKQDQNTTRITEHIDTFVKIKTEILNRGGRLEDITIARKLLNSLHSSHRDEVRHIIRVYVPLTFRGVTLALKQYELENSQLKNKSISKTTEKMNGLNMAGNTNFKKKCTPTHCQGTHKAAKCFAKPENAAAKKAWFDRMRSRNSANHVDSSSKEEETTKPETPPTDPKPSASNTEGKKKDWAFPTFCAEANSVDSIRGAIWDSGASQHMFRSSHFFDRESLEKPNPTESQVGTAGSEEIPIEGTGTVWLKGQTLSKFRLLNVLYVPGLRHNLIAAGALHKQGAIIKIDPKNEKRFEVVIGDDVFSEEDSKIT
ncbi:hypothetical protein PSHT_05026 [Puccinia striiformis]|uniref:Retrovirus-related Pol polyprotein from transposon TNT 1-94-like beta-barrel domain-containing protein n=1 Tax=Puccinia striiformis TaxID=27350 RepID=A0A2S4WBE8_9BASI|nr:hypothetical protein PSHT_05026 [Puccinia striiformis]